MSSPKTLPLPSGRNIPILGQGTWRMAEEPAMRESEIAALRLGLDLGMTLIDTAEMYGEGAAEELVAEVVGSRRSEVFLVSKIYPQNATRRGAVAACHRSLKRLGTDHLDLYLLHWRGEVPLAETLSAFQSLKKEGAIRDYGVSNFDLDDMEEAVALDGGGGIVINQVLYNLEHRGIEWDLLPWCEQHAIPIMAYSPIGHSPREQKKIFEHPALKAMAARKKATPAQIALAWVLRKKTVAIPKASDPSHVRDNRAAMDLEFSEEDLHDLNRAFPPPREKVPLEVL